MSESVKETESTQNAAVNVTGIPIFGIGKLPLFGTLPGLLLFPEPFPSKLGAAFGAGNPGSGAIGNGGFIIL